jgi:Ca2+-binding RTX toxin-like protein
VLAGGKILVFGDTVSPSGDIGAYVLRLNGNGTPDTSFGQGGYHTGLGNSSIEPLVLADGRILATDLLGDGPRGIEQPAIARLLANGSLDPSFNPAPGVPKFHSAQPFTITASDLLRGWTDPDSGDSIHLASVAVDHGTVQVQGTGEAAVYTITATNGYSGTLTLTYTVADSQGASSTGTRTFAMQNAHPTGGVFIAGTAAQGQTLTASNTLADADGVGTISYQWLMDGSPIAGATGATLLLGLAHAGRTITVLASYVDGFGTHESVSSKAVVAGGVIAGTLSDDSLVGTGGADVITALAGNDTIASGGGSDTIDGGDGFDTVRFSGSYGQYVIANGSADGIVLVTGPDGGQSRLTGVENLQFADRVLPVQLGTDAADVLKVAASAGSVVVDAGDGNDVLTANDSGNALLGGGGNDQLTGGAGGDNLDGGTGNDTMTGGLGDDVYVVDSVADVVVESSAALAQSAVKDHNPQDINLGGGIDKVVASINYTLGNFVENLTLADGAGNLSGTGNALDNVIVGNGGANALSAAAGNDTITGGAGNDTIDGGDGRDTAFFSGNLDSYAIARTGTTVTISGRDGTDTLTNVERAHFDDFNVAFDIDGDAGLAYRLYQAAFNRVPDIGGLGYQMHDLDIGVTLEQVAANFIASPEFQSTYGNVDDTQFLTLLYNNVLHRAPDEGGLQFHLDEFAHGQSRAVMLIHFSESPENQANVIGAIENGMVYTF